MDWRLTKEEIEKLKPQDRMMRGIRLNSLQNWSLECDNIMLYFILTGFMFTYLFAIEGSMSKLIIILPSMIGFMMGLIVGVTDLFLKIKMRKEIEKEYREIIK